MHFIFWAKNHLLQKAFPGPNSPATCKLSSFPFKGYHGDSWLCVSASFGA